MDGLVRLEQEFGFVPRLFRVQTQPHLVEAQIGLIAAILLEQHVLSRIHKERVLRALAAGRSDAYWMALHHQNLEVLGDRGGPTRPVDPTRKNEANLETVLTMALGSMLGTFSAALRPEPDFAPPPSVGATGDLPPPHKYLHDPKQDQAELASFLQIREIFGILPAIFGAQNSLPSALNAQASAMRDVFSRSAALSAEQKLRIALVVAEVRSNPHLAALLTESNIAAGSRLSASDPPSAPLLDFARKLASDPDRFTCADIDGLLQQSFTEGQVEEAIAAVAIANFLNILQAGLGVELDSRSSEKVLNPSPAESRPTTIEASADPDVEQVVQAQNGDLDAFEMLVNRHSQRVYRTLLGMLGNPDEARDAMQDTFLKVFQNLGRFERRSKFSTWLVSIASNTGLQRLRERKRLESLDEDASESNDGFRPRQVRAWTEDPERLYSQIERRALVEKSVMQLPAKYRVVVMLRDVEQLSAEETAAALGIGIPALKSRLLRGRLMVREALAPHFGEKPKGAPA